MFIPKENENYRLAKDVQFEIIEVKKYYYHKTCSKYLENNVAVLLLNIVIIKILTTVPVPDVDLLVDGDGFLVRKSLTALVHDDIELGFIGLAGVYVCYYSKF